MSSAVKSWANYFLLFTLLSKFSPRLEMESTEENRIKCNLMRSYHLLLWALLPAPLKSKPDKNPTAFDTGCKKHPWHVCLKVSAAPFIVKNGFGAFRIRSTMLPGSCQFGSAGTAGTAVAGSYILLTSHWMCFKGKTFPSPQLVRCKGSDAKDGTTHLARYSKYAVTRA